MKQFLRQVFLVLFPFVAAMAIELFILPIDQFCLRCSEALIVFSLENKLPGPFYPTQRLERDEVGNLGARTDYAVTRHCLWITDRYGYRYDDRADSGNAFDIVIVGDSQVEGAGLSQDQMLNVVLGRDLGRKVYPYASCMLNDFLHDPRFQKNPPKVVIYGKTESAVLETPPLEITPFNRSGAYASPILQNAVILADRALKSPLLNTCKAEGRHLLKTAGLRLRHRSEAAADALGSYATLGTDGKMLFRSSDLKLNAVSDAELERIAQRLDAYRREFEKRGIQFIFLPIPDKSSVYYELVSWRNPPDFLPRLMQTLKHYPLDSVDTLAAYLQVRRSPAAPAPAAPLLYQQDDTHWGAEGIRVAAGLLGTKLKKTRF